MKQPTRTSQLQPLSFGLAWADTGRQQAAVATECAVAMFRGFEAIRKVQEDAARQAATRHERAAQRLLTPCQPTEVFEIQADLLQFDLEAGTRYWQQLSAAALEMQTQMLACCTQLVDSASVLEAVSSLDAVSDRWLAPPVEKIATRAARA